jgi:hypothetical protein
MRAEEGDETVNDYAAEGKQTFDRIRESQRARRPVRRAFRRITKFFRSENNSTDG